MKFKDIKPLMKDWKEEEKAAAIGTYSRITKSSYFSGKPKHHWIGLNFEFLRDNQELDIDFFDSSSHYSSSTLLAYLLAYTQPHGTEEIIQFIKDNKLEYKVISTIQNATYLEMTNLSRTNYYFSVRDCIKDNLFDLNNHETKEKWKAFFKTATTNNNKKFFSEALFSIAEVFYDKRETLDKQFVLEMLEYFLVTGKYIKANWEKIIEMSNWREEQLSMVSDTIEGFSIIKKLNPVKIGMNTNQDKNSVDRLIVWLHDFLNKKLYTQEQYISIDLTDKAADKVFIITYEQKTKEIENASEMISYFGRNHLPQNKFEEVWQKIELKNKISENLPTKNTTFTKNKI